MFLSMIYKSDRQPDPTHWVDEHGDYLFRFGLFRVQDEDLARDLVQDTLLAALKARDSFTGSSSERTWLTSILKRKIADHFRQKYRYSWQRLADSPDSDSDFSDEGPFPGHWSPDSVPGTADLLPDELAERAERIRFLQDCIGQLNGAMQELIRMREFDDLPTSDICLALGITDNHLWVLLHRARKSLRKCLETKLA